MPPKPPHYCWRCEGVCTGKCQVEASKQYDRDRSNDPFHLVYKTARWRRVAKWILERCQYVCQDCKVKPAVEVDHVVPARKWVAQGNDFFDKSNLQGLCKGCHSAKTGRERAQ